MKHSRGSAKTPRRLTMEWMEPRRLLTLAAELAVDVYTGPEYASTTPQDLVEFNGLAIYSADLLLPVEEQRAGRELWRSDGTPDGTFLLKDIAPGTASSNPMGFTNVNGTLYFAAAGPGQGLELWRTDGTASGTVLVKDIQPGEAGSSPRELVNVNGLLFFVADDGVHGAELWKSDGTAAGTKLVRDIKAGTTSANPHELTAANGQVFFVTGGAQGNTLWKSNGTAAGTTAVLSGLVSQLTEVNGNLFFSSKSSAAGTELGISDGTAAGTRIVKNINAGTNSSLPDELTNVNGTLLFGANDGTHGRELWRSDGTEEGTQLVADLAAGAPSFAPTRLVNDNGRLLFTNAKADSLWTSNGFAAGTEAIVPKTATSPLIGQFSGSIDGTIYFAGTGQHGSELWKTDGTAAGTMEVKDIYPGQEFYPYYGGSYEEYSSSPGSFTQVGAKIVFVADDDEGVRLWTTDGTAAGTVPLDNKAVGTISAHIENLSNFNGQVLFGAGFGVGLWISDGTAAGTHQLAVAPHPQNFTQIGDIVYFTAGTGLSAESGAFNYELWKTDGTAAGTVLVADLNPDEYYGEPQGSRPDEFVEVGGKVFFNAFDAGSGLWFTDGTAEGTQKLAGTESLFPRQLTRLGERLVFIGDDGVHGNELMRTNGTPESTRIIKDINPGKGNSGPLDLFVFGGTLFFSANDGVHGRELWKSDGSSAGTVMVRDLAPGSADSRPGEFTVVQSSLMFTTTDDAGEKKLWKTDGTSAGTIFIADIGKATYLTNVNGILFFTSDRGSTGRELWRSDGTAAGTRLVKDLVPGAAGSDPKHLQRINGVLVFEAVQDFWISNGSEVGTYPLDNASAGLTRARYITNANGTIYFAGTDPTHGQELWRLTTANPVVQFSGTLNYKENAPLQLLAPFATISDGDNTSFAGGRLSVVVGDNASSTDRLEIRQQGSGAGQISVVGSSVRYGGVAIGKLRTDVPPSRVIVDLFSSATIAATQALLRNIGYRNTSDNPGTLPRTVIATLTDGSGGISSPVSKTISVTAINDAPRLVLGGQVSYQNNSAGVLLAPSATVADPDSADFAGAGLTVEITTARGASNRLQLGGGYSIDGDRLLRNGVEVGSVLANGFGWNDLRLRFNSQMNSARVQELLRSLRFRTVDNTNLDPRAIAFTLTDGDGGMSATQTKTVNLTA